MAKPMVRDLAVKEALKEEIKDTLEQNNQSYYEWCAQADKEKTTPLFPGLKCNKKKQYKRLSNHHFLFVIFSKQKIILVRPATLHSYGNQLAFDGSSVCS